MVRSRCTNTMLLTPGKAEPPLAGATTLPQGSSCLKKITVTLIFPLHNSKCYKRTFVWSFYFKILPKPELRMLPEFFFSVFCLFGFDPRACECVNLAGGASRALNEISFEQLLCLKTFRLPACKVPNSCVPSGRPYGPQRGRFAE